MENYLTFSNIYDIIIIKDKKRGFKNVQYFKWNGAEIPIPLDNEQFTESDIIIEKSKYTDAINYVYINW